MMINISTPRFAYISIFTLVSVLLAVFCFLRISQRTGSYYPKIEIAKTSNDINVYATLAQIKRDIAPIAAEEFLSQIRIISSKSGGIRLADFKDESTLAKYGFKKEDILKEINGQKINNIEEAVKACGALEKELFASRDAKEIKIALDRGGKDINMNFKIPEFVPEKVSYTLNLQKAETR